MNLWYLEKKRIDVFDDHNYAQILSPAFIDDRGDSILLDDTTIPISPRLFQTNECTDLDVHSSTIPVSECPEFSWPVFAEENMECDNSRNQWNPSTKAVQFKIVGILRRCSLEKLLDTNRVRLFNSLIFEQFAGMSDFFRLRRIQVKEHLRSRRIGRCIRNFLSSLFWCPESCFLIHSWCITSLPHNLLNLYCDGFRELWNQDKVNSMLSCLNKMSVDRGIVSTLDPSSPVHNLLQLRPASNSFRTRFQQSVQTNLAARHLSNLACHRSSTIEMKTDQPVLLVCFTFPAHRSDKRLGRLLHQLNRIGRVSLETPEEETCELLRLRMRLYIRRLLTLLDDPRPSPVYLVGFGVSSILVLHAALQIYSPELRYKRHSITGLICIGMPLRGLKGRRGEPSDPLLGLPPLPTLLIVGANSRLGGRKEALQFRRQLVAVQNQSSLHTRLQQQSTDGQLSSSNQSSDIHILTIGGADHLLRLSQSACELWCTTQEEVDGRILNFIEHFLNHTERNPQCEDVQIDHHLSFELPRKPLNLENSPRSFNTANTAPITYNNESSSSSHPRLSHTRKLYSYFQRQSAQVGFPHV